MARTADRPVASRPGGPGRRPDLRLHAGALSFVLLSLTVNLAGRVAVAGGLPRLRLRLHGLAQAPDAAEHRHRRRGGRGSRRSWAGPPSTGSLSGTAIYLFAIVFFWTPPHFWALIAAHEGRVRQGRRADAAGRARRGRDAPADPALHRPAVRGDAAAVLRGRLRRRLPRRVARAGRGLHRRRRRSCTAAPTAAARCACTSSPWPTWRCCSSRWWPTSASDPESARHGPQPRPQNIRSGLIVTAVCLLHVRHDLRRRGHLHRMRSSATHARGRSARRAGPAGEEIHLPGPSIQPLLLAIGITVALLGVTTSLARRGRRRG